MIKSLKKINEIIRSASPSNYDNVSYNTYFKNLSIISDSILEEKEGAEYWTIVTIGPLLALFIEYIVHLIIQ